jgi:hypothetical protein
MRAICLITIVLRLASPSLGFAERPRPSYTTLVVQFVGDSNRPVFPIIISTSQEEGEWYRQRLFQKPIRVFVNVDIVPVSILHEITALPLLRRGLKGAKLAEEKPKTTPTVKFIAGAGHDYGQIMLDAQVSMQILEDIAKCVARYPTLKSEIQEVEKFINQNVKK